METASVTNNLLVKNVVSAYTETSFSLENHSIHSFSQIQEFNDESTFLLIRIIFSDIISGKEFDNNDIQEILVIFKKISESCVKIREKVEFATVLQMVISKLNEFLLMMNFLDENYCFYIDLLYSLLKRFHEFKQHSNVNYTFLEYIINSIQWERNSKFLLIQEEYLQRVLDYTNLILENKIPLDEDFFTALIIAVKEFVGNNISERYNLLILTLTCLENLVSSDPEIIFRNTEIEDSFIDVCILIIESDEHKLPLLKVLTLLCIISSNTDKGVSYILKNIISIERINEFCRSPTIIRIPVLILAYKIMEKQNSIPFQNSLFRICFEYIQSMETFEIKRLSLKIIDIYCEIMNEYELKTLLDNTIVDFLTLVSTFTDTENSKYAENILKNIYLKITNYRKYFKDLNLDSIVMIQKS